MIIFLYGPDDYRRAQKKKELIAEFRKKRSDQGLDFFDFGDGSAKVAAAELERLEGFLRNDSIFSSVKLAVLTNAFEMAPEKLAKVLQPLAEEKTTQVLISEKDKPLKALNFLIAKPVLFQKFEHLADAEWMAFIKSEAKKAGVMLDAQAAQFLAQVYQNNSWGLVTELQKLGSLKAAAGSTENNALFAAGAITKKDLDAFDLEAAPNYWALLNGLKSFDIRNRLTALETLLGINDPAAKIFNIAAAQAGPKIPLMAGYDLAVKSGRVEYEEALVDFVLG